MGAARQQLQGRLQAKQEPPKLPPNTANSQDMSRVELCNTGFGECSHTSLQI